MNISNDNDALIAAAPDLLEAVAALVQWLDEEDAGSGAKNGDPKAQEIRTAWFLRQTELCSRAQILGRVALAKARGEA